MVNYTAIFVAALVGFALGAMWYGPLFGKKWMKLTGMTKKKIEKDKDKMPMIYLGGFITAFVSAAVLAYFIDITNALGAAGGVVIGFWVWLGFIATISMGGVLWEQKPIQLWTLNNAYELLRFVVVGAIIGAW